MAAGKSLRYIQGKLKAKGIDENLIEQFAEEQEYDPFAAAMRLARKKHLGPFRRDEEERRGITGRKICVLWWRPVLIMKRLWRFWIQNKRRMLCEAWLASESELTADGFF